MDKKFSFATLTVRNYNRVKEKEFSDEYREVQNQFANSKSQFFIYLAELGLEVHKQRKQKLKEPSKPINDLNKGIDEISELLNMLIDFIKNSNDLTFGYLEVLLLLDSAILEVLGEIVEGNEVDSEDIHNGLYDRVPERFLRILKKSKKAN
ncbi:MAG: hypothetical protein ACLSUV_01660 [Bacilli bacterium]